MSFGFGKSLICSFCRKQSLTSDENFPNDLHDELSKHNIPQIHWICTTCEKEKGLVSNKNRMEDELEELKAKICKLDSDMTFVRETEIRELRNVLENLQSIVASIKEKGDEFVADGNECSFGLNGELRSCEGTDEDFAMGKKWTSMSPKSDESEVSMSRNKTARTILQEILKEKIKIDESQAAKSAKIVTSFIMDTLIPTLSMDDLFACLYKTIYYTGSSYNDLRISEATEYDINIVLNVPKQISLEPEFYKDTTTFAKIKWYCINEIPENKKHVEKFLQKVSESGVLDPSKLTSWLQSLIDKFILNNPQILDVKKIKSYQSGPARTVELTTVHGYSICIDLVPVFEFNLSSLKGKPVYDILKNYPLETSKKFWFLVPKTCKGEQMMYAHETKLSWRVHLPEVERAILHNRNCAKPIIKLLKLLRDKLDWNGHLSSYACTTVVLWELSKNQNVEHWNGKSIFKRLKEVMKCLTEYLNQRNLPYFFNPEYNLLHKLNKDLCNNMSNRMNRIISSIEEDVNSLKLHF